MITFLFGLIAFIAIYAFSWAVTCGIIYLICLCLSLTFELSVATGIWLIMLLIKGMINGLKRLRMIKC